MNTIISRKTQDGTVYLNLRGHWVSEPVALPEQFGQIYSGNKPTHAVYSEASLRQWGLEARAISHHWSSEEAEAACKRETASRHDFCIVLAFENIQ